MWPFRGQKPGPQRINRSAFVHHRRVSTGDAQWMSSLVPMVPLAAQLVLKKGDQMKPEYRKALEEVVNETGIRNQVFEFLDMNDWVREWTVKNDVLSKAYDARYVTGETVDEADDVVRQDRDVLTPGGASVLIRQPVLKRKIRVNLDTATFGTLVHELLHYCCARDFGKEAKRFALEISHRDAPQSLETFRRIAEGPTEFYTRRLLGDESTRDERQAYSTEYLAVKSAIDQAALTKDLLDRAYFQGDDAAFQQVAQVLHMGVLGHGMGDVLNRGIRAGRTAAAAAGPAGLDPDPKGNGRVGPRGS